MSMAGRVQSEETKRRMSKALKGRVFSKAHCKAIAEGRREKPQQRGVKETGHNDTQKRGAYLSIAVRIPKKTLDAITAEAKRKDISFAERIRQLLAEHYS